MWRSKLLTEIEKQEKVPRKKRFGNSAGTGKIAVDRMKLALADAIGWVCTTEESNASIVDVFALTVDPPYKVALIQVKSMLLEVHGTIPITKSEISDARGPIYVFVIETKPNCYDYLVLSYDELKTLALNSKYYDYPDKPERSYYAVYVPRTFEGSTPCKGAWSKIGTPCKNAWDKMDKNACHFSPSPFAVRRKFSSSETNSHSNFSAQPTFLSPMRGKAYPERGCRAASRSLPACLI
jgi:hypothetical protein